jgi:excisionase family DNA binding protein
MACTWLTVQEAAIYLKLSVTTIRRYMRSGRLKVSRPGGKLIRICLDELAKLGEEADSGPS